MADEPTPARKRKRRWPFVLGAAVMLILLLIALLPTLVTWGLGQGFIRRSIAKSVNGDVQFARLKASWFGDQSIESLRVTYPNGQEAANLNIVLQPGLYQILTHRPGPVDMTISGTIRGEVREDGSLSFQDLVPARPPSPQPQPSKSSQPFRIGDLPPMQVNIAGLDVHLKNLQTQQALQLRQLTGTLKYEDPTRPIEMNLNGQTLADQTAGSVSLNGLVENLFSPAGTLTLNGASMRVEGKVEALPVPVTLPGVAGPAQIQSAAFSVISDDLTQRIVANAEVNATIEGHPPVYAQAQAALGNVLSPRGELALAGGTANLTVLCKDLPIRSADLRGQLQQLRATAVSNDLTKTIVIAIDSQAQLEGQPPSVLAASLSVDELLAPDGTPSSFDHIIERTTGTVQGTTVPTVLVQPMLANTPINAARDLGPVVDINASFSSGTSRDVSIVVAGLARLEMQATVDTQARAIEGKRLLIAMPELHPDVVRGFAGVNIDRPAELMVRLNSFALPLDNPLPLQEVAVTGTIGLRGPFNIAPGDHAPPLTVQQAQLHLQSAALAQGVKVEGSATVDEASVTLTQNLTNLFDAAGNLDPLNALPIGTIALNNVRSATLIKFLPQQQDVIQQIIGPAVSVTIDTAAQQSYLTATVQATAAGLSASSTVTRRPDALQVGSAHAALRITPQLAASLQKGAGDPIIPTDATTVSLSLQSFEMPATGRFAYALPSTPISVSVESQPLVIKNPPALTEPLGISGLFSDIALTLRGGDWTATATGDVELRRPSANQSIANIRYRSEAFKTGQSLVATATLGFTGLSVTDFEQMLGRGERELSQWTGEQGDLNVHVEYSDQVQKVIVRPLLPHIHGEFTAVADADTITISGETHEMTLTRAAVEARMNPRTPDAATSGASASPSYIQLLNDVPIALNVNQIRLPRTMIGKAGFDPAKVVMQAQVTGGPLRLVSPGEVRTTLDDLRLTINSSNLGEGIQFALRSSAEAIVPQPSDATPPPGTVSTPARQPAAEKSAPGTLEVNGTVVDLVNEQSQLNLAGAKLRMNARAANVPTAVADALANMQGMLSAAVGPMMTATFKAQNFSLESGRLETRIETTNGFLESIVLGRQKSLRINTDNPLKAELAVTPPLRERLLYKIHPIFADIRTTEQPLRAAIPWAQAGFKEDGSFDVADLNANVEITIGKVALDSGSTTLFLLRLFGQADKRATIPGEFEPIVARIRKGIVTYDRFAVRIDKYTMVYSGQINLVNQTMNLRTEVPLAALGQSIRELEPYADKIIVPIVTRGKFGEQKTTIDPDFDIGKEAIKAGFGGTLENLLRDRGGLGGLLDQLNRHRK